MFLCMGQELWQVFSEVTPHPGVGLPGLEDLDFTMSLIQVGWCKAPRTLFKLCCAGDTQVPATRHAGDLLAVPGGDTKRTM